MADFPLHLPPIAWDIPSHVNAQVLLSHRELRLWTLNGKRMSFEYVGRISAHWH